MRAIIGVAIIGLWSASGVAQDLPRITKLAPNVYAYEHVDPTKRGVTANNLIVITSLGSRFSRRIAPLADLLSRAGKFAAARRSAAGADDYQLYVNVFCSRIQRPGLSARHGSRVA